MKEPLPTRSALGALLSLASASAMGVGLMACSANVGADPSSGAGQRLAVVDVRIDANAEAPRVDASAHFVSVKDAAATADAVDLLGLGYPQLAMGTCSVVSPTEVTASPRPVRVDLRDLSPVSLVLKGDDEALLPLEPRAFPDVAGLVSGVVFVTPPDALLGRSAQSVAIHVAGGPLAELDLPKLPARIQLADSFNLVDALPADGRTFSIDARALDVQIDPLEKLAVDDRFALDFVREGVVRARCGVDETGHVRIDANALGGVGEATLIVRAQRRLLRDDATLGKIDVRLENDLSFKLALHE